MNLMRHWIEQERVMCLCGRIATGTTPGGVPECDNPDCSWAENFERHHPAIATGAVEAERERIAAAVLEMAAQVPRESESFGALLSAASCIRTGGQ